MNLRRRRAPLRILLPTPQAEAEACPPQALQPLPLESLRITIYTFGVEKMAEVYPDHADVWRQLSTMSPEALVEIQLKFD